MEKSNRDNIPTSSTNAIDEANPDSNEVVAVGGEEAYDMETDRTQMLVNLANQTFLDLCKTLESEQMKLVELENRRMKLFEDMQNLRAEIENEKSLFKFNVMENTPENLCDLNKVSDDLATSLKNEEIPSEPIEEFLMRQRLAIEEMNKIMADGSSDLLDPEEKQHKNVNDNSNRPSKMDALMGQKVPARKKPNVDKNDDLENDLQATIKEGYVAKSRTKNNP